MNLLKKIHKKLKFIIYILNFSFYCKYFNLLNIITNLMLLNSKLNYL